MTPPRGPAAEPTKSLQLFLGQEPIDRRETLVQTLVRAKAEEEKAKPSELPAPSGRLLVGAEEETRKAFAQHVWGHLHALTYALSDVASEPPSPSKGQGVPQRLHPDQQVAPLEVLSDLELWLRRFTERQQAIAALDCGVVVAPLRLLGCLHAIVERRWKQCPCEGLPEPRHFEASVVTAKLLRQLNDPLALCTRSAPAWCSQLVLACPFMFSYDARKLLHQSQLLGITRALHHYQQRTETDKSDEVQVAQIPRQKVRIERSQLLPSAHKVMASFSSSLALLEVQYQDEVGTGSGPTLESYTSCIDALKELDPPLFAPSGAFHPHTPDFYQAEDGERLCQHARLFGHLLGKCLLDSRLVDVDVGALWPSLRGTTSPADLEVVDPSMARSFRALQAMDGEQFLAVGLDWQLPGFDVELRPGAPPVQYHERQQFIDQATRSFLVTSVEPLLSAFRQAFFEVLPTCVPQLWSSAELSCLLGAGLGATKDAFWTVEHLQQSLLAQHGYKPDSPGFLRLLEAMSTFTQEERKQFLQFVTGAPALPAQGFAGLKPALTVVRRDPEPNTAVDHVLPSVMTCAHYLKLPEYTSLECLSARLRFAMREGASSFHLS